MPGPILDGFHYEKYSMMFPSNAIFALGKHREQIPQPQEMNQDVLPLLFEAVSVNSNYTSKIEVSYGTSLA